MIFWDSSAIVPLTLAEEGPEGARGLLREDPDIIVWWGTPVEVLSALGRSERARAIAPEDVDLARRALADLGERWNEILPSDEVRDRAGDAVLRHPLRAADSFQLAAALTWARGRPREHRFLSLDGRLASAARQEGFDVVAMPEA